MKETQQIPKHFTDLLFIVTIHAQLCNVHWMFWFLSVWIFFFPELRCQHYISQIYHLLWWSMQSCALNINSFFYPALPFPKFGPTFFLFLLLIPLKSGSVSISRKRRRMGGGGVKKKKKTEGEGSFSISFFIVAGDIPENDSGERGRGDSLFKHWRRPHPIHAPSKFAGDAAGQLWWLNVHVMLLSIVYCFFIDGRLNFTGRKSVWILRVDIFLFLVFVLFNVLWSGVKKRWTHKKWLFRHDSFLFSRGSELKGGGGGLSSGSGQSKVAIKNPQKSLLRIRRAFLTFCTIYSSLDIHLLSNSSLEKSLFEDLLEEKNILLFDLRILGFAHAFPSELIHTQWPIASIRK